MKMRPPFPLLPAAALAGTLLVKPFAGALKAGPVPGAEPNGESAADSGSSGLNALLRDALFEEEATRDLTKAAAGYEALLAQWDAQRPTAAAALFRLAEVRRKQDRKADAIALYQRLLREFPNVEPHAKLARENLTALGAKDSSALTPAEALQKGIWTGDAGPNPPAPGPFVSDEEAAALQRLTKLSAESPDLLMGQELSTACSKGWLTVVRFLVSNGVTDNGNGFIAAARNGHLVVVKELLPQKPLPEFMSRAVDAAVQKNRTAVVKLLLESGAPADGVDPEFPPLALALAYENREITNLLLDHKANVNPPHAVVSPLFAAAYKGDAVNVKRLLSLGARIATGTASGYSPSTTKIRPSDGTYADPLSSRHSLPIHAAAWSGSNECISLLIEAGADVNARNESGWPPIHLCAERGWRSAIELLLASGAHPDGNPDYTPLAFAVELGRTASVEPLLKGKANPNIVYRGITPMTLAVGHKDLKIREDIIALLLNYNADPTLGTPNALQKAPADLRRWLLRNSQYPALAGTPTITLVFGNEAFHSPLAERTADTDKPGTLPALLTAWNEKGGWQIPNGGRFATPPDWSTLHLWRKGSDGKLAETVIEVKKDTAWPELRWGDVIEILAIDPANDPFANDPERRRIKGLPPETLELLKPAK